jgi:hypothetical protein
MEGIREMKVFVSIKDGFFQRNAIHGDDISKLITIQKESGNYDVMRFNYLEGAIEKVYIETIETKIGPQEFLYVLLANIGEERVLRLFLDSDAARAILDRLPNIGRGELITLHVGRKETRDFIWITNEAGNVPLAYTSAEPGPRPAWNPVQYNGKTIWDKSAQNKFYKQLTIDWK